VIAHEVYEEDISSAGGVLRGYEYSHRGIIRRVAVFILD